MVCSRNSHQKAISKFSDHRNYEFIPRETCGVVRGKRRISGGTNANLMEFPWMAQIVHVKGELWMSRGPHVRGLR